MRHKSESRPTHRRSTSINATGGSVARVGLLASMAFAAASITVFAREERSVLVRPETSAAEAPEETNVDEAVAPIADTPPSSSLESLQPIPLGADPSPRPTPAQLEDHPLVADASASKTKPNGASTKPIVIEPEAAIFHGVQPGATTTTEMLASWGAPANDDDPNEDDEVRLFIYKIEPFRRIEVTTSQDVVTSILVELNEPLAPSMLAKQLDLDDIRAVIVRDDAGEPVGVSFPERAVSMTVAPGGGRPAVSHVLLETIDAEPFVLRAESEAYGLLAANRRDLEYALELNPQFAKAKWLLARNYLMTGQPTRAEAAAEAAVELAPQTPEHRLTHAAALAALGRLERAIDETKNVLDADPAPLVRARAIAQVAEMSALGSVEKSDDTVKLLSQAIAICHKMAKSDSQPARREAKTLLTEYHLAIAEQIARGNWRQKQTVVPKWIDRASEFAEESIENDGGNIEMRLEVAQRALGALSEFQPMADPTDWVRTARETADTLFDESEDELWTDRIHWRLGMAYYHALHIAHVRGSAKTALDYGRLSALHLSEGAKTREASPANEHLVGRLYFRIGAVHAIHFKDHDKAAVWYAKATPLLKQAVPVTHNTDPQRHGDALVSMGVSFWRVGQKDLGLELTDLGADILTEAARNNLVEKRALIVPYNNLATMHKELGHVLEAQQYTKLARGPGEDDGVDAPRILR